MRKTPFLTASLVVLAMCPATAFAQANPNRAVADQLFREARDAMTRKDYATACSKFEESYKLEPALGALFNLANCRKEQGRVATAAQLFEEVAEKAPPGDERSNVAHERATALAPRIPQLTIAWVGSPPANAQVLLDGLTLAPETLGRSLPVDPGNHVVLAKALGRGERRYQMHLSEGQAARADVELGTASGSTPPATARAPASATTAAPAEAAPASGGSGSRTLGFVIGGIGIAGIGTALAAGGLALSKKNTVAEECSPIPGSSTRACSSAGLDAGEQGKTWTTVANIAFGVGVVGLGVGTYLVLSAKGEDRRVGLRVHGAPGKAGVLLDGAF